MSGYKAKQCPGCGHTYTPRRHDQKHCSKACGTMVANTEAARAKAIYRELYHWAMGGEGSGKAMSDASRAIRKWVKEDKEAGVAPPPLPERLHIEAMNKSYEARLVEMRRMMLA